MSQQGAALQTYNNELVKCIEELSQRRAELQGQIEVEEVEKSRLEHDIHLLSEKLAQVNESLARKLATRADYDHTIAETESAYMKILESSQVLLNVVKRESSSLQEAVGKTGTTTTREREDSHLDTDLLPGSSMRARTGSTREQRPGKGRRTSEQEWDHVSSTVGSPSVHEGISFMGPSKTKK